MFNRGNRKQKKLAKLHKKLAKLAAQEPAAQGGQAPDGQSLQRTENDGPTVGGVTGVTPSSTYDVKDARDMRRGLQKALKRPVILPDERWFVRAKRQVVEHRGAIIGLGMAGVGVASVVTGGAVALGLGIGAACLPALNLPAFFDPLVFDPNLAVTLKADAVVSLLNIDAGSRAEVLEAAIGKISNTGRDKRVTLSGDDIAAAVKKPVPDVHTDPVRAGVGVGLTVMCAGVLLLALTLIPEGIHGLMTRAASVILIVGVLIVAAVVANSRWLAGRETARSRPAIGPGDGGSA
jgi:hypothetical protein